MSKLPSKIPKSKPRNPFALPAKMKKAGPLKDRRAPKGGSTNKQTEFLETLDEETEPEDEDQE